MSAMSERVILCDLGGVLIELNWQQHARALFSDEKDSEELKQRWLGLRSAKRYEAGKIDFSEFYRDFIAETGSKLSLPDFEQKFIGIIGPLKADCLEILARLAQHGELAMLSNTNALHVEHLQKTTSIFAPFQHLFFSYEMGMVKPDREIYQTVCSRLQVRPQQVLFFDDSSANVAAAREVGLLAHLVNGPDEIERIVKNLAR